MDSLKNVDIKNTESSSPSEKLIESNDLIRAFQVPKWVSNLVGLPPIVQYPRDPYKSQLFYNAWIKFKTLLAVILPLVLTANLIFNATDVVAALLSGEVTTIGIFAGKISGLWWWTSGFLIYMFFLFWCKKSSKYFLSWTSLRKETGDIIEFDSTLARDVNMICFVVLSSATVDTLLYHIYAMRDKSGKVNSLSDFLQDHFESNQYLARFFSKNEFVAAVHFFINKLMLFAINFGDILLMMISRAIYGQFRALKRYLEQNLDLEETPPLIIHGKIAWNNFHKCFLKVLTNLEAADKTYYTLIWISYETNVFFICNQLFMGIHVTDSHQFVHRLYVVWSFFHLIFRTLAVNFIAAQINEHSNKIYRLLQYCSPIEYNDDVRRLERYMGGKTIGLAGDGVFVITRPFILTIISAIFTLEVVLLQNSA